VSSASGFDGSKTSCWETLT